jgi:hypothetical protein
MADEEKFKFGAAVDQYGVGLIFKKGESFLRGQVFHAVSSRK